MSPTTDKVTDPRKSRDVGVLQAQDAATDWSGTLRNFLGRSSSLWTFGVLVIITLGFAIAADGYFTKQGWNATSISATEILLLGVGETFVIVSGGIDLSVGSVLGLSGMTSAWVMQKLMTSGLGPNPIMLIGLAAGLGIGALFGFLNGLVITRFSLTPFIVTLGTLGIAQGCTQLMNGGQEISDIPAKLPELGNKLLFGGWVALPVLVTAVVAALAWVCLAKTRFGRRSHAIGSNSQAVTRTGVNVNRHLLRIYTLSGLVAGLAGYIAMSQLGVATITAGANDELSTIVAVVIGGASLYGGRGSIAGTVVGALIVAVLQTGLVVAKTNSAWQLIAVGLILIGALLADRQRVKAARTV